MHVARPLAAAGAAILLAAGAPGDANAQQIYKIVGPDGRITFSDQPPAQTAPAAAKAQPAKVVPYTPDASARPAVALPFELRQAASRYPVTLYTSPGCQTCASGRQFLVSRGIPFSERIVATKEDADALNRLTGLQSVPVLSIGAQQLRGFSDVEWSTFLDAAGYPKTSQLPPSYVPPPATPLVAQDQSPAPAPAAPPPATQARTAPAPAPSEPPPSNPAGITF